MKRALLTCIGLLAAPASADVQLSFYGGVQSAPSSDISIRDPEIGNEDFSQDWEGRSFDAPPYYGIRATRWQSPTFGFGLDFAHNKVYPTDGSLPDGYDVLEFTDGLNTLTVNAYRRWNDVVGDVSPYVGGGIGVALPHVEVTNGTSDTFGYQLTGPAATWIAGASMPINDQWAVFGEYKGTFSSNTADLETGGTLETDIVTNAVNFGVSFNF
ncbi:outer membrane beta-barrel protein [Yoonia sp. F2084L]|uniref:outer membrane protein n=1 Tax=Yoonia sp. F2084L TaxID=2926419 RepID=UPI001FF22E1D|nr:outer membrane beta-barrel protein [Yoonia sp. F2084L]MCK0097086.1 outer membrane beta-barrel protein [Yoonia sp. F2084L]